ncbi:MAG: S-layer homology domain-containing protein [Oscillospiraceae bacterium]|nr:S-layer homology domain-containing protein [Oscillospiraceae bacterium]
MSKRWMGAALAAVLAVGMLAPTTLAKTSPAGETVGNVLFYVTNTAGEEILVSQVSVSTMEADMQEGKISTKLHNYSVLDRFVTTLHQEAQGFTVGEFIDYAQGKSTSDTLRALDLSFQNEDKIAFWEIDQTAYDDLDTYTYNTLYGVERYNFPLLYKYWDYTTQDYADPEGKMTRDEVIDYIFENGESENFLLSVRAFSQRYMITSEKMEAGDYNMENYWSQMGYLDNQRTIRMMKPMTKDELYNKTSTAADTRYWVSNIKLDMVNRPTVTSLGNVATPTATMTEDSENYYVYLSCATEGATILYNHNFASTNYTPTSPYGGTPVIIPKTTFKTGTVTLTARAVKEGYTDEGVVSFTLTSSGTETGVWTDATFSDVAESDWSYEYAAYVFDNGLFDMMGTDTFAPNEDMTRAMLVTALYRMAGSPTILASTKFTDVADGAAYKDAVAWAYTNGVVTGTSDTTFAPDASITREQITAMLYRYAENIAKVSMTASDDLAKFSDKGALSAYAVDSMQWAVGAGLINGMTETELQPQGTANRAQVAAMVMRLAQYLA